MLGIARTHPTLTAWLATAVLGFLVSISGPLVVVITAELFLPLDSDPVALAHLLHLLVLLFYVALLAATALTLRAALRRLPRRR